MTVQVEHFLNSLSEDEKAELDMLREHEFSFYSMDGYHFPHLDEKEDLLSVLSKKER